MNSDKKKHRTAENPNPGQDPDSGSASTPEESHSTLGEKLRRARSAKGVSLEEAAAATRIHLSSLEALEGNHARHLPAQVFTRGFVRIYAGYLGLDPDQALRLHVEEQGLPTTSTTDKINIQELLASEEMAEAPHTLTGNHVFFLLLMLVLGFLVYWGYNSYFRPLPSPAPFGPEASLFGFPDESAPPPEPDPPFLDKDQAVVDHPAAAIPATRKIDPDPAPRRVAPIGITGPVESPYVLAAHFLEETWVRIQVDDQPAEQLYFYPGNTRTWQAAEKLEIRIGNAGGVELSLNNSSLPTLGRSGQIVDLRFP